MPDLVLQEITDQRCAMHGLFQRRQVAALPQHMKMRVRATTARFVEWTNSSLRPPPLKIKDHLKAPDNFLDRGGR
jgi:hypothetical protein